MRKVLEAHLHPGDNKKSVIIGCSIIRVQGHESIDLVVPANRRMGREVLIVPTHVVDQSSDPSIRDISSSKRNVSLPTSSYKRSNVGICGLSRVSLRT